MAAHADDVIFPPATEARPNPFHPFIPFDENPPTDDRPKWVGAAHQLAGQLIVGLLGSMIADQSGLEYPATEETPKDVFAVRLGDSHFKVMLQGAGNLRALQGYDGTEGTYLFTVLQAGMGVQYDVIIPDGSDHSMLLAIRLSPIYGEIAMIRTPNDVLSATLPPQGLFAGSSLGVELSKRFGFIEPGARAYTRTEWENINRQNPALSYYAAIYTRFYLNRKTVIMPIVSYYDRGDAQVDMYSWNRAQTYGSLKGFSDSRNRWEGKIKIEVKF